MKAHQTEPTSSCLRLLNCEGCNRIVKEGNKFKKMCVRKTKWSIEEVNGDLLQMVHLSITAVCKTNETIQK
jgi:hypothetical protein